MELHAYLQGALVLPPPERVAPTTFTRESYSCLGSRGDSPSQSKRATPTRHQDAVAALGAAGRFLLTPQRAELERIRSLQETGLLDSPPEERFDWVVRAARNFFKVSCATLSLISSDKQFLKSVSGAERRDIPRQLAFCSETIRQNAIVVSNDAAADERFAYHPFVLGEPFIRFYAGYPLHGPRGWNIGSLCLIDVRPRSFPLKRQQQLREFAGIIQRQIDAETGGYPC